MSPMPRPSLHSPATVTPALLRDWALPAPAGSKDARGRTLIVGGSSETAGAVLLAAEGALRCGAGKLQVATADSVATGIGLALPEALVRGLGETSTGAIAGPSGGQVRELAREADSVLIGPGLADAEQSAALTRSIIDDSRCPLVIDALGLAAVTADKTCLRGRAAVLTPNTTELAIIMDVPQDEVAQQPARFAVELSARTGAAVSIAGETSYVAAPDGRVWADDAGGLGLGVSGSGDVRAGIVAGLLARGAKPAQAAVWATHVHGRAGERLASTVGRLGYLARELPEMVPPVLLEIEQ
jgi:ADP-dependent NAD(P)H-hydrate dehydratase